MREDYKTIRELNWFQSLGGGSCPAWNNPPQTHSLCQKHAEPGSEANSWFFSRCCGLRRGSFNKNHVMEPSPPPSLPPPHPPPHPPYAATDYTRIKSFLPLSAEEKRPPLASTCSLSLAGRPARGGRSAEEEEEEGAQTEKRTRSAKPLLEDETRREKTQFTVKTQAL